jgi:hypothetical protein
MKFDTRTGELYEQHAYSHDHLNAAQLKPASHEGYTISIYPRCLVTYPEARNGFRITAAEKSKSYPRSRPWRPIGLGDVTNPTV